MDELDDETLGLYLAAQGALSQWPTPQLGSKGVRVEVDEITISTESTENDDDDAVDGELDLTLRSLPPTDLVEELDISTVLVRESASLHCTTRPEREDTFIIESILLRACMPTEIVAMSLNILSKLHDTQPRDPAMSDLPVRLLVTSALCLASAFMDDSPPPPYWWNRQTCCHPKRTSHVHKVNSMILKALDWRLHDLASAPAIAVAMQRFERMYEPIVPFAKGIFERAAQPLVEEARPLALVLQTSDHGDATVRSGQLTPDDSPTEEVMFLPILPPGGFLPVRRMQALVKSFLPLL